MESSCMPIIWWTYFGFRSCSCLKKSASVISWIKLDAIIFIPKRLIDMFVVYWLLFSFKHWWTNGENIVNFVAIYHLYECKTWLIPYCYKYICCELVVPNRTINLQYKFRTSSRIIADFGHLLIRAWTYTTHSPEYEVQIVVSIAFDEDILASTLSLGCK